jgi:hypothetical protein
MTILVPQLGGWPVGLERTARRRSSLVLRLIRAHDDPAKRRVRDYLLAQTDDRLKKSLGFSDSDICALRRGRFSLAKE